MTQKNTAYDVSADVIRILAGILVILIHATDRYLVFSALSSGISGDVLGVLNLIGKIAVPLFVLLSGYLLLKKDKVADPKKFYQRRIGHILIPFIVWVIIYFFWMWYWGRYQITPLFIWQSIFTGSLMHLYFLPLIALLYLLTPFLAKFLFSKSPLQQWTICFGALMSGLVLHLVGYFWPYLSLEKIIFTIGIPYIGYYIFGALVRTVSLNWIGKLVLSSVFLVSLMLSFILSSHNINAYPSHSLSPFILVESMSAFLLLVSFGKKMTKLSVGQISVLRYIASTVFGIYLIHIIVLDVIGDKIAQFNPYSIHSPILFYALCYFVTGLLASFVLVSIGKKLPFVKHIFG